MTTAEVNMVVARLAAWEPEGTSVALLPVDQNRIREQAVLAVLARDNNPEWDQMLLDSLHAKRGEV